MARCCFCGGEDSSPFLFNSNGSFLCFCSVCRHYIRISDYEIYLRYINLYLKEAVMECPTCKRKLIIMRCGDKYVCVCLFCNKVVYSSTVKPEVKDEEKK